MYYSLQTCTAIEELYISCNHNLMMLPKGVRGLKKLKRLDVSYCDLIEFPDEMYVYSIFRNVVSLPILLNQH